MKSRLVTLKEAVEILDKAHNIDPEKEGRHAFSMGTLYNAIYKKMLKRYGPSHLAQVDMDELLKVFGPKKAM